MTTHPIVIKPSPPRPINPNTPRPWIFGWFFLGIALHLFSATNAHADNTPLPTSSIPVCGDQPDREQYDGLLNALTVQNNQTEEQIPRNKLPELLIYFQNGSADIPTDCNTYLLNLRQKAKQDKLDRFLIRSGTRTGSSSELDLAMFSQRLDTLKRVFRKDPKTRRVLMIQLSPITISPMLSISTQAPRILEIYSTAEQKTKPQPAPLPNVPKE